MEMINVDYTLAHNIVYAGLEFAEDYGFKPHKDFTTTTQFMLEEDTDDIELMEIECGKNGKPLYVQGPMDNQAKAHKVIAQLEKTAGTGNFHYILEVGSRPFGDDFDDDYVNEFDNYSLKKKHEILAELLARADNLSAEEKEKMSDVTLSIYNSLIEIDKVNDYFHILMEQFDDYYFNDELSEEFLGSTFNSNEEKNKFLSLFIDLYESFDEDNKAAKKKLKALYKKYKNIPVLGFIELMMLNKKDSSVYETKLKQYHQEFPYYPLLNLLWARHQLSGKADDAMSTSGNPGINDYFPGRELLNYVEIFHYIIFLIDSQLLERTPSKLEAIEMAIEELELPEPQLKMLDEVIKLAKFTFIIASKQNL